MLMLMLTMRKIPSEDLSLVAALDTVHLTAQLELAVPPLACREVRISQ